MWINQDLSKVGAKKYIFWAWSEDFVFIILATQFPYT